jgi:hypothetical protein
MRIVIEKRIRHFLLWATEADEEVNIYHCEKCKNDYKQDDLEIERSNVQIANENLLISWLVRLRKITLNRRLTAKRTYLVRIRYTRFANKL